MTLYALHFLDYQWYQSGWPSWFLLWIIFFGVFFYTLDHGGNDDVLTILLRWEGATVAGSRATWRRSCSVWAPCATSATCSVCCTTASFTLTRAKTAAATMVQTVAFTPAQIACGRFSFCVSPHWTRSPPAGPTQPNHSSKMNPVIADVVSLANGSAAQPSAGTDAALTGQSRHPAAVMTAHSVRRRKLIFSTAFFLTAGSLPTSKNLDHVRTQCPSSWWQESLTEQYYTSLLVPLIHKPVQVKDSNYWWIP